MEDKKREKKKAILTNPLLHGKSKLVKTTLDISEDEADKIEERITKATKQRVVSKYKPSRRGRG